MNCDNPLLSSQSWLDALGCSPADVAAGTEVTFYPGKRFVEGSPRNNALHNTAYRMLGGIRGDMMEGWKYDAYFQYANTHASNTYDNDGVIPNMQNALFAIDDSSGNAICRDAIARVRRAAFRSTSSSLAA
ncbi:MAG: hypothetical protein R3C55_16340 [Parvularculaceae bacterium]